MVRGEAVQRRKLLRELAGQRARQEKLERERRGDGGGAPERGAASSAGTCETAAHLKQQHS